MISCGLYGQLDDKVRVETIIVSGAKKTKPQVVLRELTIAENDTISLGELPALLERNQQNIFNLGLFNEVVLEPIVLDDYLHLVIHVKERWYIFPFPKIKPEERNSYDLIQSIKEGDFHRVSYGLDLTWYNVTGRNETLSFYGQLGFSKRFSIRYSRPAIFGMKYTDLLMGFSYINKNEIITGTEGSESRWSRTDVDPLETSHNIQIGIRKRLNVYKSITAVLNYSWRNFNDSLLLFNQSYLPNRGLSTRYPSLTLSYANDQRDYHTYPLNGLKYQVFLRYAGPPDLSSHQFLKAGFTWAQYQPLSNRWNFSYGFQSILTLGENLPYFEKSAIGLGRRDLPGISTELRGYERFAIDGSFVGMAKAELKFAIIPYQFVHVKHIPIKCFQDMPLGMYLTAYADLGYVGDETSSNFDTYLKNQALMGYGFGLNLIGLYDMLLRVEYSRNHLGQGGFFFHSNIPIK